MTKINRAFSLRPVISSMIAIAMVMACSEAPRPATPPPAVPKPAAPPVTAAVEAQTQAEKEAQAYAYTPAGRRDPFMPLIIRDEKKAKKADLPPLQRHNIDEFRLTGIVWGGLGYNAMIEGPDGKGYFIKVGTLIGPNQGTVKKITKDAMFIEEKYKTYTGEAKSKEIIVELHKKREGM